MYLLLYEGMDLNKFQIEVLDNLAIFTFGKYK